MNIQGNCGAYEVEELYDKRGPKLITIEPYVDKRGDFFESYNQSIFRRLGLPTRWVQDNISLNNKGVFRGMHIQKRYPQGKLISCLTGEIEDFCIDLRIGPTYANKYKVNLQGGDCQAIYIPPGFAHGFLALTDCVVSYKCTTAYNPKFSEGINARGLFQKLDEWLDMHETICSSKDKALPSLVDYKTIYR